MDKKITWVPIKNLKEPYNDAVNYKSKDDKEFFSSIFLRTQELNDCLSPSIYYIIGEKGTGKTAYAVFLENNEINNCKCKLTTMTETQYKRFIELKKQGKLSYSDFANIWRSMLLLIVSQMVVEKSKAFYHSFTNKFTRIEQAIKKWNHNALNPEVESAFEALVSDAIAIKLNGKNIAEVNNEKKNQENEHGFIIKHHLLETESTLKEAIKDLKIAKNHILFIDGIDFRPEGVAYPDYIECIKGLSEAAWQLNTEFFNSIKDSIGRLKIVLLIRPDVFHKLNLYNSNSRLQDNCVLLDWSTTERDYEKSQLLEVSGRYFSNQQCNNSTEKNAWDHYFGGEHEAARIFKKILRNSFQKPRDILTYIKFARRHQLSLNKGNEDKFDHNILISPKFSKDYADYLLGEVKNYATFYMTLADFAIYLKIFLYLDGKSKFSMDEFEVSFLKFKKWVAGEEVKNKDFLRDSESLLQFFYEVNVIGYHETAGIDNENFYHWAYRERSINNIAPKVKTSGDLMLNPGIAKALDIGKKTTNKTNTPLNPAIRKAKPKRNKKWFPGNDNRKV